MLILFSYCESWPYLILGENIVQRFESFANQLALVNNEFHNTNLVLEFNEKTGHMVSKCISCSSLYDLQLLLHSQQHLLFAQTHQHRSLRVFWSLKETRRRTTYQRGVIYPHRLLALSCKNTSQNATTAFTLSQRCTRVCSALVHGGKKGSQHES